MAPDYPTEACLFGLEVAEKDIDLPSLLVFLGKNGGGGTAFLIVWMRHGVEGILLGGCCCLCSGLYVIVQHVLFYSCFKVIQL